MLWYHAHFQSAVSSTIIPRTPSARLPTLVILNLGVAGACSFARAESLRICLVLDIVDTICLIPGTLPLSGRNTLPLSSILTSPTGSSLSCPSSPVLPMWGGIMGRLPEGPRNVHSWGCQESEPPYHLVILCLFRFPMIAFIPVFRMVLSVPLGSSHDLLQSLHYTPLLLLPSLFCLL